MRVLRLITRLNIGGPSIQAIALSERLTARGFETLLVHGTLGEGEGDMRYLLSPSVNARPLPELQRAIAPWRDGTAFRQLVHLLREFRPRIVHTHMAKAGTLGRLAATYHNRTRGSGPPSRLVHTYHGHVLEGYFGPVSTHLFLALERRLARLTDRLVAISEGLRDELVDEHRIGRPDQYRVVPLGLDLAGLAAIDDRARAEARRALELPADAHVVTTVGRLTAIKQHALFLEVARLVVAADPRAVCLVVGDGELRRDLAQSAEALGLATRVRFLGWRRDLPSVYGATDVFLLTSRNEGTPVALIESFAAGVPVVSTDVGGVKDVIRSTDVGLLSTFGDARALAGHVAALLGDSERRRRMGVLARREALARYQLDRLVDDIESLYRELLA